MKEVKYEVIDHHSMWGWPPSNSTQEEAEVMFVWNDFTMAEDVKRWQKQGKKVVVFEHGWNSFFDYEVNKKTYMADYYLALGKNSKDSLMRCKIPEEKILIAGNRNFDNLKTEEKEHKKPRVLYTALHWFSDRTAYNSEKLKEVVRVLGSSADITVKTMSDTRINIPDNVGAWFTNVHSNRNLFKEMAQGLSDYDIVLTPKESTFDFIALLVGKKVFRIGHGGEYRDEKQDKTRNILPLSDISPDLLVKERELLVDLKDELSPSLDLEEVLEFVSVRGGIMYRG
jgi:hypothetical protein